VDLPIDLNPDRLLIPDLTQNLMINLIPDLKVNLLPDLIPELIHNLTLNL
jgi:hypothetical protein